MHKVFVSYHHQDQCYKDHLVQMADHHKIFIDKSVDTGDINDSLPSDQIRKIIRDGYLQDSTVTIVLVGQGTKGRKHVDWEIYSSMYDGAVNKKSGILVINLPGTSDFVVAPRQNEKENVYPDIVNWNVILSRSEYEYVFPYTPARIIDNLLNPQARISVVPWGRIVTFPDTLRYLVDAAFHDRHQCRYDLSQPMRYRNFSD